MGVEDEYRSIPGMMRVQAARYGDRTAVIDDGVAVSFAQLGESMRAVAKAAIASGVQPGDRVAIWAPNSVRWIETALGLLATGAWLVPVNTRYKAAEAAYVLEFTDAVALFTVSGFVGNDYVAMLQAEAPDLRALGDTVCIAGDTPDGTVAWADFLARGAEVSDEEVDRRIDAINPEDVSDIMFTSGTTGHPKGVMLRHGTSMSGYAEGYNLGYGLTGNDVAAVPSPFFHCFGYKSGWLLALMKGAISIPIAVFDPEQALALIERHHVTYFAGAPTVFLAMLNHPNRANYRTDSLRTAMVGAAYVAPELFHRIQDELGAKRFVSGYGLTEMHAVVTVSPHDDPPEMTATWSGKLVPGIEARLVDEQGNAVAVGERGEVLLRGYSMMSGYYRDPEATAKTIDADGWLHTGDIGFMNDEGYIKIADRKKDIYIMGGVNVAPAEVESQLQRWDKVGQAAVIGVPDDHFGEVGMAFVIPRPGVALTPEEVVAYAREKMANYKVPRRVEIVDALPLNATGKVLKNELRARVNRS